MENAKELVEEFEREYGEEAEELRRQKLEEEEKEFSHELPREFTAKLLYGWGRRRYERERQKRWDENWNQWKNSSGRGILKGEPCYETLKEERISRAFGNLIDNIKSIFIFLFFFFSFLLDYY